MDFLEELRRGPRKIAVTGHFGCGKTELSVSLAFALAGQARSERLALCDLDIENPYFRSRERAAALEAAGVRVYSDPYDGRNASELQTISAAIRAPLEDAGCRVILDCGGDHTGAMVLNQFRKYFTSGDYRLLCVVNCNRPGTDTPEKAAAQVRDIEAGTGYTVTGLVSKRPPRPGDHGADRTGRLDVHAAHRAAHRRVPALCACCMTALADAVRAQGVRSFPSACICGTATWTSPCDADIISLIRFHIKETHA
jgi:hypothetical protein